MIAWLTPDVRDNPTRATDIDSRTLRERKAPAAGAGQSYRLPLLFCRPCAVGRGRVRFAEPLKATSSSIAECALRANNQAPHGTLFRDLWSPVPRRDHLLERIQFRHADCLTCDAPRKAILIKR
jgi:hypothetical protein